MDELREWMCAEEVSQAGLAARITEVSDSRLSQSAVSRWFKRGKVPAERVLELEQVTGISRITLRPDIYPPSEAAA